MRRTARAIILRDQQLLVMERWRRDDVGQLLHYFSIPGGKIEEGETPQEALQRELTEEFTLAVSIGQLVAIESLATLEQVHYYFLCHSGGRDISPDPDSPEAHAPSDNRYQPCWIPVTTPGEQFHLIYRPLLPLILQLASGQIPSEPVEIRGIMKANK